MLRHENFTFPWWNVYEQHGGNVYIFSSMHVSGQQLQQVSGVAAILRYPLPDLEELEQVAFEWQTGEEEQESDEDEEEYDPECQDTRRHE